MIMKKCFLCFLLIILVSCKEEKKENTDQQKEVEVVIRSINLEFQKIIDDAGVKGAILIYDLQNKNYYSNDFSWAETGKLPASTYKIPNTIIALETGVVVDQNTIFPWNGEKRFLKSWEEDLTFTQAFQRSCVPCYQEVAKKIGVKRMNAYLKKIQYGNIQVDSTNLDSFWLQGNSRVNQFQQIDFLTRFYQSKLPISKRTEAIVKEIMVLQQTEKSILRGKTGWSIVDDFHNGWFVGYVESGTEVFFFATNVEPISTTFDQKKFQKSRKLITYKALEVFNIVL
jgi:beta-lactamase class D